MPVVPLVYLILLQACNMEVIFDHGLTPMSILSDCDAVYNMHNAVARRSFPVQAHFLDLLTP